MEFQGRTARCKKCNEKFEVPAQEKNLEDSVLDWLSEDADEETVDKPRVISMPKDSGTPDAAAAAAKAKGPIRLKPGSSVPHGK